MNDFGDNERKFLDELKVLLRCTFRAEICEKRIDFNDFYQSEAFQRRVYNLSQQIHKLKSTIQTDDISRQIARLESEFQSFYREYPQWSDKTLCETVGIVLEPGYDYCQRLNPLNPLRKHFYWQLHNKI